MKKAVLAVTIVLVAALVCQAQDYKGKARQGGVVFDEKGAPLEGVNVKLFSVRAQQGFAVKTDKNGKWMAAWIRSGGWTVTFEKIGYAPQNITVNVQETAKNPDVTAIMVKVEGLALTDEIKALLIQGNADFELKKFDEARPATSRIHRQVPRRLHHLREYRQLLLLPGEVRPGRGSVSQGPGEGPRRYQRHHRHRQLLFQPRRRRQGLGVVREGRVREDRRPHRPLQLGDELLQQQQVRRRPEILSEGRRKTEGFPGCPVFGSDRPI